MVWEVAVGPLKLAKVFFHAVEAKKKFFYLFSGKLDFSFYSGSQTIETQSQNRKFSMRMLFAIMYFYARDNDDEVFECVSPEYFYA